MVGSEDYLCLRLLSVESLLDYPVLTSRVTTLRLPLCSDLLYMEYLSTSITLKFTFFFGLRISYYHKYFIWLVSFFVEIRELL